MGFDMILHNRLRQIRQTCNLTQQELAQAVHVSRQTVIAIEKGGYAPSVELALKLADRLKCSVEDLFWLQETNGRST